MPTYDDLRAYFDESAGMRSIVAAAAASPIVHGFTVSVDPLWALCHDLAEGLLPDEPWRYVAYEWSDRRSYPWRATGMPPLTWGTAYPDFVGMPWHIGFRRRAIHRDVTLWNELAPGQPPVILTIIHRPGRTPAVADDVAGSEADDAALRAVVALIGRSGEAVHLEERPRASLAVRGGDGILNGTRDGTLGGFLFESGSGKAYGVSCAHVMDVGDPISDSSRQVGTCAHSVQRQALPTGVVCDPSHMLTPSPYPGNQQSVNMLDCALIDMSVASSNHSIGGVASQLSPGQLVDMQGAVTPRSSYVLGALCISYVFGRGSKSYCFRDSIELVPQARGPLGGGIARMLATTPTQGDSGSWLLTRDQPPIWAGMLFGEDGTRGFGIRASWIRQWGDAETGSTLHT